MKTRSMIRGWRHRASLLPMILCLLAVAGSATAGSAIPPEHNYTLWCTGCHRPDGAGNPQGGIPDFRNSVGYFAALPEGRMYLTHVPGVMDSGLDATGIAEVLNYVIHRWGGESTPADYVPFTGTEVENLLETEIHDVVPLRRKLVNQLQEQGISVADYPWP